MKEFSMDMLDIVRLLARIADDVHVIAEDIRNRQEKENKTIRKQYKGKEKPTWGRLI